ncbi:MAG: toll/interleukin-1 receptor domain-containing protein [Bacteroidales bacterium]|nr:toll/interleukin-1 receptor domain-containing protein [Bacteroidales bacterium]
MLKVRQPKIFVSHATADKEIVNRIEHLLKQKGLSPYLAERSSIGRHLIDKLRNELEDSNMFLVVWTTNVESNSKPIIAFETGMAWTNKLPIFILKEESSQLDWFYEQVTDYVTFNKCDAKSIDKQIGKLDFDQYRDPIYFKFPKENNSKGNSYNESVVQQDGGIRFSPNFNEIVHFIIENKINRIIRDIRVHIQFPDFCNIQFIEGGHGKGVQKNEQFDLRLLPGNTVRLMMPALPSDEKWEFELRVVIGEKALSSEKDIKVKVQGGDYTKKEFSIPIKVY